MRILVLGAYGFIGSEVARRLLSLGHSVLALGRDVNYGRRLIPQADWVSADLSRMLAPHQWEPLLVGVDVVVNASGLLQDGDGGSVAAVQYNAIAALTEAALEAGIAKVVQISAAGADLDATTAFMRTKGQADALILSSGLESVVLRPGLVVGRNSYGGTELMRAVAALPLSLKFPVTASLQCVALSDVVDAVELALQSDSTAAPIDLVEPRHRTLDQIVAAHRAWLALPQPRMSIAVPMWALTAVSRASDALGRLGWRPPLRRNSIQSLIGGVRGGTEATAQFLGREPLTLEQALASPAGKQDRVAARLNLIAPLMIASLFVMWAGSGILTLADPARAQAVLTESGLPNQILQTLALSGAVVDVLLAFALLWRPLARAALAGMMVATGVYLIGAMFLTPSLWTDPLAPLLKAIPAAVLALIAFWWVEKR